MAERDDQDPFFRFLWAKRAGRAGLWFGDFSALTNLNHKA